MKSMVSHWIVVLWLPLAVGAVLTVGCSGGGGSDATEAGVPLRREIQFGDRQKDWALVYYQSWRRAKDEFYLQRARDQMAQAIKTYFDIQVKIGHSYPDFYTVDRKRRESCRFLQQMDREAGKFRVVLSSTASQGCL